MYKLNDKDEETQNLIIKRRKLNMKKIFSNKVITSLVLILSICLGMLPFMSLTASAEDSLHDGIDCCESCAAENESLDFDFSSFESNAEILRIESTSEEIIASIKSESPFTIKGTVEKDGKITDANEYFDFSSVSRFDIAAWASRENYISEAEKIDCYCDLYIDRNFENIYCLTSVVDEIAQYRDNNLLTAEMSAKIDAVFERPFGDESEIEETNGTREIPDFSNEATYKTANFKIHYDSSVVSRSSASMVALYLQNFVRDDLITAGYNTPILEPSLSEYQVYLENDPHPDNADYAALTCPVNISGKTCASYLVIYNFTNGSISQTSDSGNGSSPWLRLQELLYHEYFHAIQNSYNRHNNWFKEACAEWAKINFLGTSYTVNWKIEEFYDNNDSITSTLNYNHYGAVLYPLTIERDFGGESTIRKIYEAYTGYPVTPTDSQFRAVITAGIQAAGYGGNFVSAYRKMTIYNCNPGHWYNNVYSGASVWNSYVVDNNFSINTSVVGTKADSLEALQSDCYKIILPSTFEGMLTFNVTFSGGTGHMQLYYTDGIAHGTSLCATTSSTQTIAELNNCQYYTVINVIISNTGTTSANYYLTVTPTES